MFIFPAKPHIFSCLGTVSSQHFRLCFNSAIVSNTLQIGQHLRIFSSGSASRNLRFPQIRERHAFPLCRGYRHFTLGGIQNPLRIPQCLRQASANDTFLSGRCEAPAVQAESLPLHVSRQELQDRLSNFAVLVKNTQIYLQVIE
jgi:hypothetical protein